jgi:NADH:ubiquinone oxidoreductase subunit H
MLGEIRPGFRDLTTAPIAFGSSSENRVPIGGNGCDNWCSRILFNLCQVIVVLAFAPLTSGVLSRLKEMVQSKTGPSIFQPYWDLWKLFHKDEIVSEESSWIFRFTPYIVFVTPIFVALLIPVLTSYPLFFAFMGDMLGGGFVLSLGGFFAALAAVDTAILTVPWARAALCLAFGVLPTYIIPVMGMALAPFVGDNAADALVPPFFASNPARHALPPAFVAEFHDLGAQVGQSVLPERGLVVLHRGGYENPIVFAMSTSFMLVALIVLLVLTYLIVRLWLTRRRLLARRPRWDGGVRRLWHRR